MRQSDQDGEFGGITMPTKPTSGRIRTQDHPMRQPAEGYSSADDDQTVNATGPNRGAEDTGPNKAPGTTQSY